MKTPPPPTRAPRPLPWKWIGIGCAALVLLLALVLPGLMRGKGTPSPAVESTNVAGVQTQSLSTAAPAQTPTGPTPSPIPATLTAAAGSSTTPPQATATSSIAAISYKESELPAFNQALASQKITPANLAQVRPLGVARLRVGAFPVSGPYGLAFNLEDWFEKPNRLIAATSGADPTNLWDLEYGRPGSPAFHLQSDPGPMAVMWKFALGGSGAGPLLVSVKDGSVFLVDQSTGALLMNTVVPDWPQGAQPCLRVLGDGKRVAIGGGTQGWILSVPGLQARWAHDFSADWQKLLIQADGKTLDQAYYADHAPAIHDISPDGNEWFLDAAGYTVEDSVWTIYSTHSRRASVSADGTYVVTGDANWVRAGKRPLPAKQLYEQNHFSADGLLIASTEGDRLRIASTAGGDAPVELAALESPAVGIAWSPDGKYFAVQEQSGAVVFYGIPWKGSASAAAIPAGPAGAVEVKDPGGQKLTTANAGTLRLIRQLKSQYGDPVGAVTFSPDGRLVAAGTGSGLVNVWSVTDGRLIYSLPGLQGRVLSLAFSNSGGLLAAGGDDNMIYVWEVASGRRIIRGDADHPTFLKFLQGDDSFVIGGNANGWLINVRKGPGLWHSATYPLKEMRNAYLKTLPAGRLTGDLASAGLHVDDVSPTGVVWYADGISINVDNHAVFAFDDPLYYKTERDRSRAILALRNVLTPAALYLPSGAKLRDLPNGPLAAISQAGSTLFAFQGERGIRLGDVEEAAFHLDLPGSPGSVNDIAFANDGRFLAACDEDGNVWVWGAP